MTYWGKCLYRWTLIAITIGIVAGIAALIFHMTIKILETIFLRGILQYNLPKPLIGGSFEISNTVTIGSPYLTPVIITLGCLLSGLIPYILALKVEGHGADAVIKAYHKGEHIQPSTSIIKLITASLTIGLGGSAGRQGPIAHITAGLASLIAKMLKLPLKDSKIAMIVGMGAGVGALFKAPLGGAIFAAEVLYRRGIELKVLYPALIASITGYIIFCSIMGFSPLLMVGKLTLNISLIPFLILLGLLSGLMARLYIKTFYTISSLLHKLNIPPYARTALGGFLASLIALFLPQIMGSGLDWIQRILVVNPNEALIVHGTIVNVPPLMALVLLPFAKMLATALVVGSGSSGGVFAPGIFIGAFLGATVGYMAILTMHDVNISMALFIVVGMLAHFAAASKTIFAVTVMVLEMTRSPQILPLALLTVILAHITSGGDTIYRSQGTTKSYIKIIKRWLSSASNK